MNKPSKLKQGDTVAIISLSQGFLGENFMAHQRQLIEQRLASFGLKTTYTPHALKGTDFIKSHPEKRASDLKWAFANPKISAIICAIGGNDTYLTVPYLLGDPEFVQLVKDNPKIFIGYSDTTINHLMFQKLGLTTYYGHSAIVDFGELDRSMLPYSKSWFEKLFSSESGLEIKSSPIWYEERTDFGKSQLGIPRISHPETHGYELLSGSGIVEGELFGGCLGSIGELLLGERFGDEPKVEAEFALIPQKEELTGKILFLETSADGPEPERITRIVKALESRGIFEAVSAVLIGKPQDEVYYEEHKAIYRDIIGKYGKPLIYNLNFGHAHPKCILPIGQKVRVDCQKLTVTILESLAQ